MNETLIRWSREEFSNLPWRKKRNLYTTLVSEIMLQQTTVSTVKKHFESFISVFPNLESLASASEDQVCAQWKGLGYYRRARNLHKAAVSLVQNYKGKFPKTFEELKSIPGIGDYTASALIAIGRNDPDLALDANLERVLARYFSLKEEKGLKLQKEIKTKLHSGNLEVDFEKYSPRELNEALMDLGRVFCQARRADCLICPLNSKCLTRVEGGDPLSLPTNTKKNKTKEFHNLTLLRVVVRKGKKVLGYTKNKNEWLTGQVEIPTFILETTDKKLKQYPKLMRKDDFKNCPHLKTAITKYKIRNHYIEMTSQEFMSFIKWGKVWEGRERSQQKFTFYSLELKENHFSTSTLKVLSRLTP